MHAQRWYASQHVYELPRYQLRVPLRRRYAIVAGDTTRWPSLVELSSYKTYYSLPSKTKNIDTRYNTSTHDNTRRKNDKWYTTINFDSVRREWAIYRVGSDGNWYYGADIGWVSYHMYQTTIQSSVAKLWVHFEHTTTNIEEKYQSYCMECLRWSKMHKSLHG